MTTVLPLILNIALLVTLSVVQQLIVRRWRERTIGRRIVSGMLFGIVAIVGMMTPFTLVPGIFFDGRSIILGIAGLFGGTLVGVIAAAMAAAYRIYLGGDGVLMGVAVIAESAALGLLFRQLVKRDQKLMRMAPLWLLGLAIHVVMIALMGLLPGGLAETAVRHIALPVLTLYPVGFLLVCQLMLDQEHNRMNQEELQRSEERYRAIVEAAPFGMYLYRLAGDDLIFTAANPAADAIIGHPHTSLLGKRIEDAFPRLVDDGIPDIYRRIAREGGAWHIDPYAYEDDQTQGNFEVTAFQSGPEVVTVVFTEVSEQLQKNEELRRHREQLEALVAERTSALKIANEQLREASEAKSRFLRAMSHELRTPLNSIIGFSEILMRGMAGTLNQEQGKQIEMINNSGRHLLELINDVLDLSRIEAQRIELHMAEFSPMELCEEAMDTLRPEAAEKGLSFKLTGSVCEPTMTSDRMKVRQILLNLLGNAVKFTESGSVVLTLGQPATGLISFEVADTGPGVAPERQERIFGEFVQAEDDDIPREGTGLGLAISRGLAAALNGSLVLQSTPGVGSTFTLTLPATPPPTGDAS